MNTRVDAVIVGEVCFTPNIFPEMGENTLIRPEICLSRGYIAQKDGHIKWWGILSDGTIPHLFTSGYKMNVLKQAWYPIFWLNTRKSFLAWIATLYLPGIFYHLFFPTGQAALPAYTIPWNKDLQKIFFALTQPVSQLIQNSANNTLTQFTHNDFFQVAGKARRLGAMFHRYWHWSKLEIWIWIPVPPPSSHVTLDKGLTTLGSVSVKPS